MTLHHSHFITVWTVKLREDRWHCNPNVVCLYSNDWFLNNFLLCGVMYVRCFHFFGSIWLSGLFVVYWSYKNPAVHVVIFVQINDQRTLQKKLHTYLPSHQHHTFSSNSVSYLIRFETALCNQQGKRKRVWNINGTFISFISTKVRTHWYKILIH